MKSLIRHFLFPLFGILTLAAQIHRGDWYFDAADVPQDNPGYVDLTLGLCADSSENPFRLGNFNVRGFNSDALHGLQSDQPPQLIKVWPDSFDATLSIPPSGAGWQINALFNGTTGRGSLIDTGGSPVVTIRFFIRDTAGTSAFRLVPLNQTFSNDNIEPVIVNYDTAGGNVPLWRTIIPDTTNTDTASTDTTSTDTTSTDTSSTDTTSSAFSFQLPRAFALYPNFPNPFNLETRIRYDLPQTCDVHVRILNLAGQTVREFDFGRQFAGEYTLVWNGTNRSGQIVTSGVYLVQFRADQFEKILKILLAK